MEVAITLAYYDTATITAVKCFIVLAPSSILAGKDRALKELGPIGG
jgi:hypothetical protein